MSRLAVWIAEGFGSGRLPGAPGTWGSLVGLAWFALLLLPGHPALFALGLTLAAALAVPICTFAERKLGETDPGRVVLDEIVAVPLCFLPLLAAQTQATAFPDLNAFLHHWPAWTLPAGFLAFRLLDIWKPWPIRAIQNLPRGWGIVADDLLAACGVAALSLLLVASLPPPHASHQAPAVERWSGFEQEAAEIAEERGSDPMKSPSVSGILGLSGLREPLFKTKLSVLETLSQRLA